MRKTLYILLLGMLLLAAPVGVMANNGLDETETELPVATLVVEGNRVRVNGAEGQVLRIYNLTGIEVAKYRIDANDVQLNLNKLSKGYYIIKVDKVVRKISIR